MAIKSLFGLRRLDVVRLGLVLGLMALGLSLLPAAQSYPIYRAKPAKATVLPAWQIKGAVKLQKTDTKTVQNKTKQATVVCGKMKGKWYAGTILATGSKKGHFLSLKMESENLRKRSNFLLGSGDSKKQREMWALSRQKKSEDVVGTRLCRAAGGSGSATPLRFNFSDAVGMTVGSATSRKNRPSTRQSSSGIKAVLASGVLRDAITSGTVTVSKIAVSPSGQIVIAFSNQVRLDNATSGNWGEGGCLIVTVDRATGIPTCIDANFGGLYQSGEAIQFDATGGIYFHGVNAGAKQTYVLRRYKNGAITDLISPGIWVLDWLVTGNGTVFLEGKSESNQTYFNRRYNAAGGILNLEAPALQDTAGFRMFSDGNVYMFGESSGSRGIARYNVAADTMDPTLWIGPNATQDLTTYCGAAGIGTGPCTAGLSSMFGSRLVAGTSSGKNFQPGTDGLVQTYPTLSTFTLPLRAISVLEASGNVVLAAGTTATAENILVKFDSDTNTVSTLASRASANGEIEFYHVEPSSNGYALFDGLRFNDNTYVIGKINYSTGEVTILSTVTGKLDDFKAF